MLQPQYNQYDSSYKPLSKIYNSFLYNSDHQYPHMPNGHDPFLDELSTYIYNYILYPVMLHITTTTITIPTPLKTSNKKISSHLFYDTYIQK